MADAIRYSIMSSGATSPPGRLRARDPARRVGRAGDPPLRQRTSSAPACIGGAARGDKKRGGRGKRQRRLLVEDHYRVDPRDKALLPGSLASDDDWDRDLHDFFNLVSLVPVVVLNVINWNWDVLLDRDGRKTMQQAWTGEWFPLFFAVTVGYFVADLIWVATVPRCVKSPGVIVQHHVATLLYLTIPYRFPEEGWLMGACLSVEVNTWLLIARRVFNKGGFDPSVINFGFLSIRVKAISILFYATWFGIRGYIYPCIWRVLWALWSGHGYVWNSRYAMATVLHSVFCLLNLKVSDEIFLFILAHPVEARYLPLVLRLGASHSTAVDV